MHMCVCLQTEQPSAMRGTSHGITAVGHGRTIVGHGRRGIRHGRRRTWSENGRSRTSTGRRCSSVRAKHNRCRAVQGKSIAAPDILVYPLPRRCSHWLPRTKMLRLAKSVGRTEHSVEAARQRSYRSQHASLHKVPSTRATCVEITQLHAQPSSHISHYSKCCND